MLSKAFDKISLDWMVINPTTNLKTGGLPHLGCPQLSMPYIRSYHSYLEAIISKRNLRILVVLWEGPW
jgi:hypothetical protein